MKSLRGKKSDKLRLRVITFTLSALLMVPCFSAFAAVTENADQTKPTVTITAAVVGGEYLELGLNVQSGANKLQSLGAVVQYPKNMLTAVEWQQNEDGTAKVIPMEAAKGWSTAAVLHTKGADLLSGKTAMAYAGAGDTAYIYLGAEAARAQALEQKLNLPTKQETVAGDNPDTPDAVETEYTKTVIDTAILGDWTVAETTENAVEQAVTARFKIGTHVVEGVDTLYTIDEILTKIALCTEAVSPSIAKASPILDASGIIYFADNSGKDTPVNISRLAIKKATTVNSGGGSASDFAPIVFYDWDEKTILGTIVVSKKDKVEDIQATIDAFTATLYPKDYNPTVAGALYDARSPMTNKKGYSFGKWVEMNAKDADGNKVYTVYGDAVSVESASKKEMIPEPKSADFAQVANGLILKAAFASNGEMTQSTEIEARNYTVAWDSFNRHGGGDSYSIKVSIQRKNNGLGVQRCRDAALRVTMKSGAISVDSLVLIEDIDYQIIEIAAPPTVTSVRISVIDIGGVSNWVNATTARSLPYSVDAGTTEGKSGFVFEGNQVYLNSQFDSATGALATTHYSVAGFNVTKGNVFGTASTSGATLRTQAFTNMQNAYNAKNANGTHTGLTWQEMADAIKLGKLPQAVPGS